MNADGELEMQLIPALPFWLFDDSADNLPGTTDEDGNFIVSYKLFASILVTYHNTLGTDLFDIAPKSYLVTNGDGTTVEVNGPTVPKDLAIRIRKVLDVSSIDVYY